MPGMGPTQRMLTLVNTAGVGCYKSRVCCLCGQAREGTKGDKFNYSWPDEKSKKAGDKYDLSPQRPGDDRGTFRLSLLVESGGGGSWNTSKTSWFVACGEEKKTGWSGLLDFPEIGGSPMQTIHFKGGRSADLTPTFCLIV